ncbi:MAG: metallophosphoesterase [Candidatus Helarchaeota archaeon]
MQIGNFLNNRNSKFLFMFLLVVQGLGAYGLFDSRPYLTPADVPETSIYINWISALPESSVLAYGVDSTLKDTLVSDRLVHFHHIELSGLEPGTRYFYRILPDSDLYTFRTFPKNADTFTFIAFGDTRSDSQAHHAVINQISNYDFDFLVHTGDLVNEGGDTTDWRTFFNIEDTVISCKQFIPAIGNHEYPFWFYDSTFALPGKEDYYRVDYGNARIFVLNTETDIYGEQYEWLVKNLEETAQDTLVDWTFAVFHRPPYSSGSHGSRLKVRERWCGIFEKYNVDLVFNGHDHSYERTRPINGVVYVVTGGGGAPLYGVSNSSWTAASTNKYHFCVIDIKDDRLKFYAVDTAGVVFDSLLIDKKNKER